MAEEEKPKKLVDAATVVAAITTVEWSEEQTKQFNALNIFRLGGDELKQKLPKFEKYSFKEDEQVTLLNRVIVNDKNTIIFKDNSGLVPDIFITESELGNIEIENCQWIAEEINDELPNNGNIIVNASNIGNITLSKESRIRNFFIEEKSTTGDFYISASTTGYFSIREKSTTGHFYISESTTGNFYISASTTGHFYISASTTGNFSIREKSTTGDFYISESTTGNFEIRESTTGDFRIKEKSTTGNFYIKEKSTTGYFYISESTTGNFEIRESTTGNFDIRESTTGHFYISASTTGYLKIKESYTGDFFIEESNSPLWEIKNCFASFKFSKAVIGQCKLVGCSIPQLHIQNQCEMELYISGGQINHLNFMQLTLGKNSIVSLSSVKLYLCNMFEFTVLGNLYFRDIGKAESTFDFFKEAQLKPAYILWTDDKYSRKPNENNTAWENYYAKIKGYRKHIKELKEVLEGNITPTFRIVKSSLAKTEFTECDLRGFRVEYKHAKLTDIFISGGKVPDNDLKVYDCAENSLTWHEQKAAFFNQLKKVFAQQGNVYRETLYNSFSAKHQEKILLLNKWASLKKRGLNIVAKNTSFWKRCLHVWRLVIPDSGTFDILTFYLNRFTNKHGASWGRALWVTLLISLLGFYWYNYSLDDKMVYTFDITDRELAWLGDWAYFVLPIHKINFMVEKPESTALFVDVLFRILIGYGIYQFISAFRKHGKR